MLDAEKRKEYFQRPEVKEKRKIWMKNWRLNNPEKAKETAAKTREKNRDKINERQRVKSKDPNYRAVRSEKEKQYKATGRRKELRKKDAEKYRTYIKKWREKNKEKRIEYMRKYKDDVWIEHEKTQRELLDDKYVIKVIKKQLGYTIKTQDISLEQIEIKRNQILINRIIKQIKLQENEL